MAQLRLTQTEANSVRFSIMSFFRKHPTHKTVKVKLGALGEHRFHRDRVVSKLSKLTAVAVGT